MSDAAHIMRAACSLARPSLEWLLSQDIATLAAVSKYSPPLDDGSASQFIANLAEQFAARARR